MSILSLNSISIAYGLKPLLNKVKLEVDRGERICLIGRNGTGKSTLFKVITGAAQADEGEVWKQGSLRISFLDQEVPQNTHSTIFEIVAAGAGEIGPLLTTYHHAIQQMDGDNATSLDKLADIQQHIEALDGWNINQKIDTILSRLELPADKLLSDCSGGVRRRVLLASALVCEPDLLLLDEPTNHMDIAAINWLEEFLLNFKSSLIFITHDRTFLKNVATRIIELDRGTLTSFPGDYDNYLLRKEEMLNTEAKANEKFDKKLAEHEVWIRQGVKARRTRNEGKVRKLQAMRRERTERINVQGKVNLDIDSSNSSGKLVADLRHVNFSYGQHNIINDLSCRIIRGDRIGIIGPNGSGKSTLIKLILGELSAQSGDITLGTKLEIGYFDQHRNSLDLEKTVRDNLSEGRDFIDIRGNSRHVISYLKDFLFPPERLDSPVKILSGGERNRLLLAKLFTLPTNMLIMDEPTNDLDVETLELLEELLSDYEGTLLLVSHDRTFLDNAVTSTLVFEEDGKIGEYVGGYDDWLRQAKTTTNIINTQKKSDPVKKEQATSKKSKKKLSFKEQNELKTLPALIEKLEDEQSTVEQKISQGEFYQQDKETITITLERLEEIKKELIESYSKWDTLESLMD